MNLKHSLSALAAAVALVGFTGCNDNDDPAETTFMSMVTFYVGTPSSSVFELIPPGNGDAVLLSCAQSFIDDMPQQGTRMMIQFKTPDTFRSRR